jgi:hypothetical protein
VAPELPDPATHLASFHPVARFSQRFLRRYRDAVERRGWSGHTEALYPTVAIRHGLPVVDLGGRGALVPPGWEERHYRAAEGPDVLSTAFGFRPPFADRYFHERPDLFPTRGRLYHPIKNAADFIEDAERRNRAAMAS